MEVEDQKGTSKSLFSSKAILELNSILPLLRNQSVRLVVEIAGGTVAGEREELVELTFTPSSMPCARHC